MANDLSALRPVYFSAAHVVSRELAGFIAGANVNFDSQGAALDESIKVPRVGDVSGGDYTPAMTTTAGDDTTPTSDDLTIDKSRVATWNMKHEDERSLNNAGNFGEFQRQKAAEAMRVLVNELESDLATEAYQNGSRAVGTAGTTPFGSNFDSVADIKKVLDDNGAPTDRCLVVDTSAGANARKLTAAGFLAGADARGDVESGDLLRIHGFGIKESAQISQHTKGTGSGYLIDNASNEVVGERTLTLDTGTGTILAGDVITHASDSVNKYLVNTALTGGDVVIGRPGLKVQADDDDAVTVGNSYTPNVAFARSALAAVVRPPIIDPNPAMQTMLVGDDQTGLTFLLVRVIGDGMDTYRVHLVWGKKAIQSEHIAVLMG
jgi:hypothetical protein